MYKQLSHYLFASALLVSLLVLSILPFELAAPFHDSQRLISTILVAVALGVSIWFARLGVKMLWVISGVYLWGLLAVWHSPLPLWSLVEFSLLFSVALLSITLMPPLDAFQMRLLAVIFVIIQTFYATRNLTNYVFVMVTGEGFDAFALIDGFSNVRFYGQFLIWTVPLVLGVLAVQQKMPYRYAIACVLMVDWGFEFLTGTRAFMLGMAVTIPVVWWVAKEFWMAYLKWLFMTAAGGFALYILLAFVLPDLFARDVVSLLSQSAGRIGQSADRIELWMAGVRLMLEHPVLGAGPMMMALQGVSNIAAHPHNYLVQLLAEWGIPFTLVLVGALAFGVVRWRGLVRADMAGRAPLALPVAASLAGAGAAGLVDGLIVMPVSLVYMVLMLAVAASLWRTWTPGELRRPVPKWLVPVLLAPALFLAIFTTANWPGWGAPPAGGQAYHLLGDGQPRFWSQGHIVISATQ